MGNFHDLPANDRPREKLAQKGPAALSDVELMAVLLGRGTQEADVMTQRLRAAGETLGIRVLDHIIFDARNHYSFMANSR